MKSKTLLPRAAYALVALVLLASAGCSKSLKNLLLPNQRPTVRLTSAPVDTSRANRVFYAYRLNWTGFDPDGRIDHYLYAIDPPHTANSDTQWVKTSKNEQIVFFRATQPDTNAGPAPTASDFHVFVIKAVDNSGDPNTEFSPPVSRAFYSFTVAPEVLITNPKPSSLLDASVTPSVRISWQGSDPDGQFTQKPIKYKFRLFKTGDEFPIDEARQDPDSVRRYYAPRNWAGWDSTSAETTTIQYTNLTPNKTYLFVIVAFDEAGAYSPVFDLNSNMLSMNVGFATTLGPQLCMFNEFFNFCYGSGGYSLDPQAEVHLEVPAFRPIDFIWFAIPSPGSDIEWYRWSMDISDLSDPTARTNEQTDWKHWSQKALTIQFGVVGPFPGGEQHLFYIECQDNNNLKSLGIIRFTTVAATFENQLLFINDTRKRADNLASGGGYQKPVGGWPTAAELDTFLFARGNVPWRFYPAGTNSPPGVFDGYHFDTLGTRSGKADLTVPLSFLGKYRHIVWITDGDGALNQSAGTDPLYPLCSMRYMGAPGRANTLSAWVTQGGQLWGLGGALGYASMIGWNNRNNDQGGTIFSSLGSRPELVPGRFMFDIPFWQSEFKVLKTVCQINRDDRAVTKNPGPGEPNYRMPDYSTLPASMRVNTPGNPTHDPIPPQRVSSEFYQNAIDVEFLENLDLHAQENLNPSPPPDSLVDVVDTLYSAVGSTLPQADPFCPTAPNCPPPHNVVMTYYYGNTHSPTLFSGFNLWSFQRADCIGLADFVLQQIWGLPRDPVSRGPGVAATARVARDPRGARALPARAPAPSPVRVAPPNSSHWRGVLQSAAIRPRE